MKKMKTNLKKAIAVLAGAAMGFSAFAQEATDGFIVPLGEDFSKPAAAGGEAPAESGGAGPFKDLKMGLWVETQSVNESLIRNLSDKKKKGYEFDNAHFITEANWWFWGKLSDSAFLKSEIAVLDFDKTLYQENTYAANVPDVTWGDGFPL